MTETEFWLLIERSKDDSSGDPEAQAEALHALRRMREVGGFGMDSSVAVSLQERAATIRTEFGLEELPPLEAGQLLVIERAIGPSTGWVVRDVEHSHTWGWLEHFDADSWTATAVGDRELWRPHPVRWAGKPDLAATGIHGLVAHSLAGRGHARRLIVSDRERRLRPPRLGLGNWRLDDDTGAIAKITTRGARPDSATFDRLEFELIRTLDEPCPTLLVMLLVYSLLIERHSEPPFIVAISG